MAQEQDARQTAEQALRAALERAQLVPVFSDFYQRVADPATGRMDPRYHLRVGWDDGMETFDLSGSYEALTALLNPITTEQVRHALLGAFAKRCITAPHWKDIPTEDFYALVDEVLSRLTGGDPPGQRTTPTGATPE